MGPWSSLAGHVRVANIGQVEEALVHEEVQPLRLWGNDGLFARTRASGVSHLEGG